MWAGEEVWESILSRQSDLGKAQRWEGQHGQGTLQPILASAKSMNSGWFFVRRPQISLVTSALHADISGYAFRGYKTLK